MIKEKGEKERKTGDRLAAVTNWTRKLSARWSLLVQSKRDDCSVGTGLKMDTKEVSVCVCGSVHRN